MRRLLLLCLCVWLVARIEPASSVRGVSFKAGLPPAVAHAVSVVRCYAPDSYGYGFVRIGNLPATCARLERARRLERNEWWLQLRDPTPLLPPARLPPGGAVYCVTVHLGLWLGDRNLDVPGVGSLGEVECPPSAYAGQPKPDLRVPLRAYGVAHPVGTVSLTEVGTRRTRVIVRVRNMDIATVETGTCDRRARRRKLFTLNQFYSFRTDTIIPASLASLTAAQHVVMINGGGAHGGDPLGCALLTR